MSKSAIRSLPTMQEVQAMRAGKPIPKPASKLEQKMAKMRGDLKASEDFKRAVWTRDGGKCRLCQRKVVRSLELKANRGEVHHRKGRNVSPQDRYNVNEAVLLCAVCHGKAQRHEVEIPR